MGVVKASAIVIGIKDSSGAGQDCGASFLDFDIPAQDILN
jgi:hypothetical protein